MVERVRNVKRVTEVTLALWYSGILLLQKKLLLLKTENLIFYHMTLVTAMRWSESRPHKLGDQGGNVISDGIPNPLFSAPNRKLSIV